MHKHSLLQFLYLFCLLLGFCACHEVPVTGDGLSNKQANKVISVLSSQGITARADKSGRKSSDGYRVLVKERHYIEAVQILDKNDLPEDDDRVSKYLASQGGFLAMNSKEVDVQRADRALAVQIEDLLENNDGVVSAKVVIGRTADLTDITGIAISLKLRQEDAVSENDVKEIVKQVVPNANIAKLKVIFSVQESNFSVIDGVKLNNGETISIPLTSFFYWSVAERDAYSLFMAFLGLIAFTALVCLSLGYLLAKIRWGINKQAGRSPSKSDVRSPKKSSGVMSNRG